MWLMISEKIPADMSEAVSVELFIIARHVLPLHVREGAGGFHARLVCAARSLIDSSAFPKRSPPKLNVQLAQAPYANYALLIPNNTALNFLVLVVPISLLS